MSSTRYIRTILLSGIVYVSRNKELAKFQPIFYRHKAQEFSHRGYARNHLHMNH